MTEQNSTPIKKSFIFMMAALMSVVAMSIDAILPALNDIGKALNISNPNHAQYIISTFFAGLACGQLISGPLSDALGRKKVLYHTIFLYLIGSVICLFSHDLNLMLLGRIIQGLGASGPYICCMSIIRDKFSGAGMAKIMSLVMMIFILAPVIAPAIGQGILILFSWNYIFILYVVYSSSVLVWIFYSLDETLPKEHRIPFNVKNIIHGTKIVLSNKKTLGYTICMGAVFGALIGDLNSAPQIFQGHFGVGKMFVVYFAIQALAFGLSSLVNAKMVEKYGMNFLCLRAFALMCGISIIFLAMHYMVEIKLYMYFIYGIILLFACGILFGNLNALALEPMGEIAGLAAAIIGFSSSLISTISGTIIGQMYDGTLVPILIGFIILSSIAFVVNYFCAKL